MPSFAGRPGFLGVFIVALVFCDCHVIIFRDYHNINHTSQAVVGFDEFGANGSVWLADGAPNFSRIDADWWRHQGQVMYWMRSVRVAQVVTPTQRN